MKNESNKDIQLRGNCPMCGGKWAVKSGRMSKHGYTVQGGWFSGVCPGERFAPLQINRDEPKPHWDNILKECDTLEDRALKYEQGELVPETMPTKKRIPGANAWTKGGLYETIYVPWADVKDYDKRSYVESLVWKIRSRAKGGRQFVEDITKIADEVHGKPLIEVGKPRTGPLIHMTNPKFKRYTMCNQRIEGMGMRARYLHTTEKVDHVSCEKCKAAMAVKEG